MSFEEHKPYDVITIKGYDVEIDYERNAENPREYFGFSSTLATAHHKYSFGGKELRHNANNLAQAIEWHLREQGLTLDDIIYHAVYLYDHSGISLSTTPFSCAWDSGCIGIVYAKRSDIRDEFGVRRISSQLQQKILNRLESELELTNKWLQGDVFYCKVGYEYAGPFYGSDYQKSGLIETATEMINCRISERRKQHQERLKHLIKCGVGIQYRPAFYY